LLAEAVYCTSWAEQQTEFWLVLAVDGDFLVYVSADGRSLWRGDEDRPAESLEAFAAPVRSYVSAVGIEETDVRGGDWGGDYGFGERIRAAKTGESKDHITRRPGTVLIDQL